jgi:hypothetical protein
MADKIYKTPMEALKTVNPELVEVPFEQATDSLVSTATGQTCDSRPTDSQTTDCKTSDCKTNDCETSDGLATASLCTENQAGSRLESQAKDIESSKNHTEHIWTSVYDFDGPGNFADDNRFRKWWDGSGQQIFNLAYFALGAAACGVIAYTSGYMYKASIVGICLFAALSVAATIYAICHKRPSSSDVFSERTQKNIRRTALMAPLLAILLAGWNCLTYGVDYLWAQGIYPGYNKNMSSHEYERLLKSQVELTTTISPFNTEAAKRHFERAKSVGSYAIAVKMANKVIRFNRRDSRWKIRRLGVLGRLPERDREFQTLTKKYKKRYGTDGYLWNTLADTAVYNRDWPLALEMANEHVKIHDKEAIAYEQRATIFQELGMSQEAEEDRITASSY